MPERPKRRKNNKNKRKNNKNNRSDVNKNNIEDNETVADESCSDLNINKDDIEQNDISAQKPSSDISSGDPNNKDIRETEETINKEEICENLTLNANSGEGSSDKIFKCQSSETKGNKEETLVSHTNYIVETPDQAVKPKPKLDNAVKSKSCDNDDCPTIVEITDEVNAHNDPKSDTVIDSNNVIIIEEEPNIEWEHVDDFKIPITEFNESVLSSTTIPLNIAHCEQPKALSPEVESSLRNYLHTLNLSSESTNINAGDIKTEIEQIINREIKYRLRRKGLAEDITYIRGGPSRSLAVIDEEGSGDSSKTSRRQSYLSDKKSDNEELEDDVFESKQAQLIRNASSDFTKKNTSKHLIPQQCIKVDAKLREPEISEARGDWSMKTVETLTGAELVYLTDSSSSTSSLYDANEDDNKGDETDVSVRMVTPTIEVTDTETLLSNTFLDNSNDNKLNVYEESDVNISKNETNEQSDVNPSLNVQKEDKLLSVESNTYENSNEIVVLSTDNLTSNLYVKDLVDEKINPCTKSPNDIDEYDLEIKVLKCELNDAINNLIKEVTSDSESNEPTTEKFKRQDSSSSVDSSQCTAKYNPTNSSLNDVSNLINDEIIDDQNKRDIDKVQPVSHVKDVIQCISSKLPEVKKENIEQSRKPFTLRNICLKKIASFPFGEKILEELANVSQRLQNTVLATQCKEVVKENNPSNSEGNETLHRKENGQIPPPIHPRKSSLKKTQDDIRPPLQSRTEVVYECLSPSQKMLMEKTNTVLEKDVAQTVEANSGKADIKLKNNQNKLEIAPMKSQTGSRLMALLRDTNHLPKLNSPSAIQSLSRENYKTDSYSNRLLDEIDSAEIPKYNKNYPRFLSDLKPVPPPKPQKVSSYFYESDSGVQESSFKSLRNNKKYFHYSTGNLSKEIESDISSIQNMHRYCTDLREQNKEEMTPRRPSLPKDLCDRQMEYICQKEKEVDAEIRRLENEKIKIIPSRGPRAPMISDKDTCDTIFDFKNRNFFNKNTVARHQAPMYSDTRKLSSLFSSSEEELLREKMYHEYVNKMAEREQRKQQKVIKVTQTPVCSSSTSKSMPALESLNSKMNNRIEQEFISKAKERWYKLGIRDPDTEDEREVRNKVYREPVVIEHKIKVIESGEEKDVKKLPTHMQEFVRFTVDEKDNQKDSTGESGSEQESAHVVVFCAVIILVLTVGKFLLRLLRNK